MSRPLTEETRLMRMGQAQWSTCPLSERLVRINRLRRVLAEHSQRLALCVTQDVERNPTEVLATDILPSADALKFLERRAARILRPRVVRSTPFWLMGCRQEVHRRPWGTVGIIGTWNYPVILNLVTIAQALVAGNTVLWKPSELAPMTAACLQELIEQAGFTADVFHVLSATREMGPMLAQAEIDHLVFTGSATVGRQLAQRLGERLIPSTLELSGCDALVVLPDANVPLAAKATRYGSLLNQGQTCLSIRRVLVHRSRYAEYLDALRSLPVDIRAMPLVLRSQALLAEQLVAEACQRGGRLLHPETSAMAADAPPRFPPTFVIDVDPQARICREPSFAPICAIVPYDAVDQLPEMIRAEGFNLTTCLFGNDAQQASQLAARLPVSQIVINDTIAPTAHPELPFGGRGPSGWGVTRGVEGLLAMTVPQAVIVRKGTFRPHYAGPDEPGASNVLQGLLRWNHSERWRDRWQGLKQLIRGIRGKDG